MTAMQDRAAHVVSLSPLCTAHTATVLTYLAVHPIEDVDGSSYALSVFRDVIAQGGWSESQQLALLEEDVAQQITVEGSPILMLGEDDAIVMMRPQGGDVDLDVDEDARAHVVVDAETVLTLSAQATEALLYFLPGCVDLQHAD